MAIPIGEKQGIQMAMSRDGGNTWQTPMAADLEGSVSSTALTTARSRSMLALFSGQGGIRYYSGPVASAPSEWKTQSAPAPNGGRFVSGANMALTASPDGEPLIGYWVQPEEGQNFHVMI